MSKLNLLDAERIIMAEMLFQPDTCDWDFLFANVKEDYFTKLPHIDKVYNITKKLHDQDIKPDFQSIKLELTDVDSSELATFTEYQTNGSTFRKACIKLKLAHFNRVVGRISKQATDKLEDSEDANDIEITNAANEIIFGVSDLVESGITKTDIITVKDLAEEYLTYLDDFKSGRIQPGLKSGYSEIDAKTLGFRGGESIIMAAYESIGKSQLMLNMVNNVLSQNKACLIFSLEMNEREILDRLVAVKTGMSLTKIRSTDVLSPVEYKRIGDAIKYFSESKLFICTDMDINSSTMLHYAKKIQKKHGLDFITIDYLGLFSKNEQGDSEFNKISYASRGLKKMAKVLNIPILTLHQLKRPESDNYLQNMPSRKMLKGSGDIEADANIILMMHRLQKNKDGTPADKATQELTYLLVDKNRNGATGMCKLRFDLDTQRISDFYGSLPSGMVDIMGANLLL